jgi:hypothetical protein
MRFVSNLLVYYFPFFGRELAEKLFQGGDVTLSCFVVFEPGHIVELRR